MKDLNFGTKPDQGVISNEAQRSGAKGEISREYAISETAALQEISPVGRNDALIQQQFRQQLTTM